MQEINVKPASTLKKVLGVGGSLFAIVFGVLFDYAMLFLTSIGDCTPQSHYCNFLKNDFVNISILFFIIPFLIILSVYLILRFTWSKKVALWTAVILLISLIIGWLASLLGQ